MVSGFIFRFLHSNNFFFRLTDVLNRNSNIEIIPEPIGKLAPISKVNTNRTDAAEKELAELMSAMSRLEKYSTSKIIGFNEKLLFPKFALPSQYKQMSALGSYMRSKMFR